MAFERNWSLWSDSNGGGVGVGRAQNLRGNDQVNKLSAVGWPHLDTSSRSLQPKRTFWFCHPKRHQWCHPFPRWSLLGEWKRRLPPLTTMWCSPPAQPVCPLPRGPSSPWPSGHHCCPSQPFALSTLVVHRVFVTFPTARFGGASFPPDYISKSLNLPTSPTMTKFTSHIPTVVLGFCPDL